MKRAILFDLDGTLVDSCSVTIGILSSMIVDRGYEVDIDRDYACTLMSQGGEKMVAALLGEARQDAAADLLEFRARHSTVTTPVEYLFDGVADGLARLKAQGFTMAICSNKPQNLCEKVLSDTGIAPYFDAIVGGQAGLRSKPAPDLLEKCLLELGVSAEQCLFVGDSELDHQVSANAKIPFYFLTYGYADPYWAPNECEIYDDFSIMSDDIAKII